MFNALQLAHSSRFLACFLLFGSLADALGADLSHRKSQLQIAVRDVNGFPIRDAIVTIEMKKHAFKFGTQIRDQLVAITEQEFQSMAVWQKRALMDPATAQLGGPEYTPTWQDAENYRAALWENFNHAIPTNGIQWVLYNSRGPEIVDRVVTTLQSRGMTVKGHALVWPRDEWPTPNAFRTNSGSVDASLFHSQLISERLSELGVVGRFSDLGSGPTIVEWDVLNEPVNNNYYPQVFVAADIYANEIQASADFFKRARAVRPDAILCINEYNIMNSRSDNNTIKYRDFVNDLLIAGAPIDRIGIQAHMGLASVSKEDMSRRINLLAETGLEIEITEFDTRDDSNQLTPSQQARIFRDMLEVAFENSAVIGFSMWGFWDRGHWRANAPLFDSDWNIKAEAAPWFDLVRDQWMTQLTEQTVNIDGQWVAPEGVYKGIYDFSVKARGVTQNFTGYAVSNDSMVELVLDNVLGTTSSTLDIDGNGEFQGSTDGLLVLRDMLGFRGAELIKGALADDAQFLQSDVIRERIEKLGDMRDIDGNGQADALTDGLLIYRYLSGLRGNLLVRGAVASDAMRHTPEEISAHLRILTTAVDE